MSAGSIRTRPRIDWLYLIKAIALIWVFSRHVVQQLLGDPFLANPMAGWPPLTVRIAQLAPLLNLGIWTIPANILRYVCWIGSQGVQVFLIASGFGLTWGLLHRADPYSSFDLGNFYVRRAERIFPLWWGAHLMFGVIWLLIGWGSPFTDPAFYLSLLGIRVTPELFYYFFPAWWYVGLLIQLYLVYPLLWQGLCRIGPTKLLIVSCVSCFLIRGIGFYTFDSYYLDAWQRGAFFITRLPEFVFGISLATWLFESPQLSHKRLRSPLTITGAIIAYLVGLALALTLPGMIVAPFVMGVSTFVVLYALCTKATEMFSSKVLQPGIWIGKHTYSLYLVHHAWVILLISAGITRPSQLFIRVIAAVLLTVVSALVLERSVSGVMSWLRGPRKERGWALPITVGLTLSVLLLGAELLVQMLAPQEVLGWGDRPALEADGALGWRLRPAQTTRLHWESFDYTVTSNSLGFPGPNYAVRKAPGTLRILVTGDGFTSAEGVDTEEAWPRLLEQELAAKLARPVEVLDFAVDGYDPRQYADIVERYGPTYRPDFIIVQTSVDDFEEILSSTATRVEAIGFGSPPQEGLYATLGLLHLRQFVRLEIVEPLGEFLNGKPRDKAYALGSFGALERKPSELKEAGKQKTTQQLARIRAVAHQLGVPLLVMMAPSAPQVCGPEDLVDYPRNVDLADTTRYDANLPQREMSEVASTLGLPFYDLRVLLKSVSEGCPYKADSMQWTAATHQEVAEYLANRIVDALHKS